LLPRRNKPPAHWDESIEKAVILKRWSENGKGKKGKDIPVTGHGGP
jgi:hypothetical protein